MHIASCQLVVNVYVSAVVFFRWTGFWGVILLSLHGVPCVVFSLFAVFSSWCLFKVGSVFGGEGPLKHSQRHIFLFLLKDKKPGLENTTICACDYSNLHALNACVSLFELWILSIVYLS